MSELSDRPITESLAALMAQRGIGVRDLATLVEASPSHLSRVMRGDLDKRPSIDLLERLATALDVPPVFFLEYRVEVVAAALLDNPALLNRTYRTVCKQGPPPDPKRGLR